MTTIDPAQTNTTANATDNTHNNTTNSKGILTALTAFIVWGFFPLYFKLLKQYDATEIIAHRIIWTFVAVTLLMLVTKNWQGVINLKNNPKLLLLTCITSLLITGNWLIYVWAVNHDHILEASLGYFISPLMGVLASLVVLKEKLRKLQWFAIGLAIIGVIIQLILLGKLPLISFGVAGTFAVYGLMHKRMPVDAMTSMLVEAGVLVPFFIGWIMCHEVASSHAELWVSPQIFLLMLAGPVTLIPLLMYNKATKLVPFSLLSFMNYITPSLIFLLAIFYYHEPFDTSTLVTFGFIWAGLAMFSVDLWQNRK